MRIFNRWQENMPKSAFLGPFSSVLDRISFVFGPNIKIKKGKFADFFALSFCNERNFLAPFVKKLKSSKCAMVCFFRLFSCVFDCISLIFLSKYKNIKKKICSFFCSFFLFSISALSE